MICSGWLPSYLKTLDLARKGKTWLNVDGHIVDRHFVVCHLGRFVLGKALM
jgi:hypothetical protein